MGWTTFLFSNDTRAYPRDGMYCVLSLRGQYVLIFIMTPYLIMGYAFLSLIFVPVIEYNLCYYITG